MIYDFWMGQYNYDIFAYYDTVYVRQKSSSSNLE